MYEKKKNRKEIAVNVSGSPELRVAIYFYFDRLYINRIFFQWIFWFGYFDLGSGVSVIFNLQVSRTSYEYWPDKEIYILFGMIIILNHIISSYHIYLLNNFVFFFQMTCQVYVLGTWASIFWPSVKYYK